MTITVESFLMFLAWISLLMATLKVLPEFRYWSWGWGGMLLWLTSLFVSINVH